MCGRVARVVVSLMFRALALALGVVVTYAAAGLGPVGLIVLAVFLPLAKRPVAQALARIKYRTLPLQV